jgi:hypothetical protein
MGSDSEGRRYSSDDRAAAAVLSGLVWGGVTMLPFAALMTVLDAFHPMLVVAWVLLPGVVGYAAPGLVAPLIRRRVPDFGRAEAPSRAPWESWEPRSSPGARSDVGGDHVAAEADAAGEAAAGQAVPRRRKAQPAWTDDVPIRLVERWPAPDPGDAVARGGTACGVGVAPDGSWLAATGSEDGVVRVWDTATGALRTTLTGHARRTYDAVISPDGRTMATGSYDQTVRIWDLASWRTLRVLSGPTRENVAFWSLAFAPDGSWLATADTSGVIGVWDTATWELLTLLKGHYDGVLRIAVAPDGSWLMAGDNEGRLWIWDTVTWQVRTSWQAHPQHCWAVAVAPDGTWLVTGGGRDQLVRVWDTADWRPTATLRGHEAAVHAVAIAAGGQWLASGGDDGVRLWEPRTGREVAAAQTPGTALGLAGLPDDSALVIGSQHGIQLLDLRREAPTAMNPPAPEE